MIIRNVSGEDLSKALTETRKKYNNNVIWNKYKQTSETTFRVTLKVLNSHDKGARLGQQVLTRKDGSTYRKHISSACWHAHGDFFDNLLNINENAVIVVATGKIYKDPETLCIVGNWEDRNIGSMMNPLYYSVACDCGN